MIDWLKKLMNARSVREVPVAMTPAPAAALAPVPSPPLYFLDVDETGRLFLRFAHATSSAHASSIWELGLQPLRDVRAGLLAYLTLVFPGKNAVELLDTIDKDTNRRRSALVTQRLEAEAEGLATLSLLPLGSKGYLGAAASNAVHDGGEVFMVARQAVNALFSTAVSAPYPGAVSKVFVVRHYLIGDPPNLLLDGTCEHGVSLREAVDSNFSSEYWCTYGLEFELAVSIGYPAEHIEGEYNLDQFLQLHTAKASPAAIAVATAMLTTAQS